jgi:hypothetical protein
MSQENSSVRISEILTDIVFQIGKGRPLGTLGLCLLGCYTFRQKDWGVW